ncbi:isochorismatase family protein [Planctomycetota bacterium]
MFEVEKCCLAVVDVQGKLAGLMHEKEKLFDNIVILIKVAKKLDIPILWCQQVPSALGQTVEPIAELLSDNKPIDKSDFSCYRNAEFKKKINELGRSQVLLCGIETHVCIYQTGCDLEADGFDVGIICDGVSSRTVENKQIALDRMAAEGIALVGVEMILFELLQTAKHPAFREIVKLIK